MEFPHLERLTRARCRELLPGATVGRLAVPTPKPESMRERIAAIDLDIWPGGDRPHVVRIRPYRVHGTAWSVVSAPVIGEPVPTASAHQA